MAPYTYSPIANEKHPIDVAAAESQVRRSKPSLKHRAIGHFVPAVLLTSALLLLFRSAFVCHGRYDPSKELGRTSEYMQDVTDTKKVALEAHIMSKCPDARDCLQQLVVPAMEQVSDKVDFRMSYIGRVDDKSDAVACMHGPSECLGDMIELCAARIYPDPKLYLGFANCMTSNYSQIPDREFVQSCALEHGVDFERVNKCISEEGHGSELLRNSVLRSQDNNVTKSCTVRLAGDVRCIRDGGKWYDCPRGSDVADLVRDIEKLYEGDSEQI
ncbi:hypothetical protein PMZ80_008356 [Knufia obscura]|uniref:Uncharacterized protein n=1 Tax=Knufia obscura TaxID=1635080 RepID=A0ABR0RFR4_9EURO|nr:hypothetical protein PMZ80_008356 [Knufia obscura]